MENKLRNKNGYKILKIRLLIVLCLVGGYTYVFMYFNNHLYSAMILTFSGLFVAITSIILLMYPIHIRYNGHEQSV